MIDMPLNAIPPTTTMAGFRAKLAASRGQCWVDVGFYGGLVPGNAAELRPLVEAGVRGFKGFLIHSGVDEFPAVSAEDIALALTTLRDVDTTLMFHAEMLPCSSAETAAEQESSAQGSAAVAEETVAAVGLPVSGLPEEIARHDHSHDHDDCDSVCEATPVDAYSTFLASRPPVFETTAVEQIIALAPLAPRLPLHIVHLSATECIPLLRRAREAGIPITAETCFHYLGLAADDIADGDTRHKCCPPIRNRINQDGLWAELARPDSVIRTIVSDHSPCTPDLKLLPSHLEPVPNPLLSPHADDAAPVLMRHSDSGIDMTLPEEEVRKVAPVEERGDFMAAWGGIASVGLGLSILHTAAQERAQQHSLAGGPPAPSILDIVRLCCQATAQQVGLAHRKGGLRVGMDADVCVFDDAARWTLSPADMRWKNRCSPWEGHTFQGRVRATWLRGHSVYELGAANDGFAVAAPVGEAIVEKRGTVAVSV